MGMFLIVIFVIGCVGTLIWSKRRNKEKEKNDTNRATRIQQNLNRETEVGVNKERGVNVPTSHTKAMPPKGAGDSTSWMQQSLFLNTANAEEEQEKHIDASESSVRAEEPNAKLDSYTSYDSDISSKSNSFNSTYSSDSYSDSSSSSSSSSSDSGSSGGGGSD